MEETLVFVGVQCHGVTLILTFNLPAVALTFKTLSGLYLTNHKV